MNWRCMDRLDFGGSKDGDGWSSRDELPAYTYLPSACSFSLRTWMNLLMRNYVLLLFFVLVVIGRSRQVPVNSNSTVVLDLDAEDDNLVVVEPHRSSSSAEASVESVNCFPGIGFKMPREPPLSLNGWWCSWSSEYAFVGFSYEVSQCELY